MGENTSRHKQCCLWEIAGSAVGLQQRVLYGLSGELEGAG